MTTLDLLKFYERAKLLLVDGSQLDRDILHVHLGLAIFTAALLLLRRPLGHLLPLLVVVGFEAANEAFDVARYFVSGWPWTPRGTLRDLFDTLLWPTALTLAGRMRRARTA